MVCTSHPIRATRPPLATPITPAASTSPDSRLRTKPRNQAGSSLPVICVSILDNGGPGSGDERADTLEDGR